MSSNETVIAVRSLSKCYHIYDTPKDRLKQFILPRFQKAIGLQKRQYHRDFWALKNVAFEIARGETVGIIGKNGSGKSTLLQIICGTLYPSEGSVEVNGRIAALLELGSGFNPEFTGRENVYLYAGVMGLTRQQTEERFSDIEAFADIGDFIDQPVKTYSSGMMVRLAFAVIAHVDADILIIDEALAVGDVFFTQKCMRFLRQFREKGTLLFVSHDSGSVTSLCNRAVWLDKGQVVRIGAAKTVCEEYFEHGYSLIQAVDNVKASAPKNTQQTSVTAVNELSQNQPIEQDHRLTILNESKYRNDIELFEFNPNDARSFGQAGARICNVVLMDENRNKLAWIVGGEIVELHIEVKAEADLYSPIVGFFIKDRLGQALFGDNTYLSWLNKPKDIKRDESFTAIFTFRMPIMPCGDYSICVAVAEGTQHDHVQHHWIHDALIFRSHSSSVSTGLVGIPMQSITMEKQ